MTSGRLGRAEVLPQRLTSTVLLHPRRKYGVASRQSDTWRYARLRGVVFPRLRVALTTS